ncbi:TRAP transporter small permease [Celeribacter sp. ULVN23_4]
MRLLKLMHRVEQVFLFLAAAILIAMALITFVDVIGRYVFNKPLGGAFELVAIGMALMIFAALPEVTARNEHIMVSLMKFLPMAVQSALRVIMAVVTAIAFCVLAWRFFDHAARLASYGDYAMYTGIPYAPVAGFMALASGVAGVFRAIRIVLAPHQMATGKLEDVA